MELPLCWLAGRRGATACGAAAVSLIGRAIVGRTLPSDAINATRTAKVVSDQIRELCFITLFSLYYDDLGRCERFAMFQSDFTVEKVWSRGFSWVVGNQSS